jgi:hypothetical protein
MMGMKVVDRLTERNPFQEFPAVEEFLDLEIGQPVDESASLREKQAPFPFCFDLRRKPIRLTPKINPPGRVFPARVKVDAGLGHRCR